MTHGFPPSSFTVNRTGKNTARGHASPIFAIAFQTLTGFSMPTLTIWWSITRDPSRTFSTNGIRTTYRPVFTCPAISNRACIIPFRPFGVLIRNSPFGRAAVEHWMQVYLERQRSTRHLVRLDQDAYGLFFPHYEIRSCGLSNKRKPCAMPRRAS